MIVAYHSEEARKKWILDIFGADMAKNGGVVRRAVSLVKEWGSVSFLKSEVRRRRFHLIWTGDQYVVLCHKGDLRLIL